MLREKFLRPSPSIPDLGLVKVGKYDLSGCLHSRFSRYLLQACNYGVVRAVACGADVTSVCMGAPEIQECAAGPGRVLGVGVLACGLVRVHRETTAEAGCKQKFYVVQTGGTSIGYDT